MPENSLLESLPPDLKQRIMSDLKPVEMPAHEVIAERGKPFQGIYFPRGCLISVVVNFENGSTIEAELVGKDGYTGIAALLGRENATSDMFVQVAGAALRMERKDFQFHLNDERFRATLGAYSATAFSIVGQLAGCVAFHPVEQRLARWLLMVRDRIDSTEFPLTQDFIAVMLGVYRPTVTTSVRTLERAGLIEHRRGMIRIIDGEALEQAACECYQVIRDAENPAQYGGGN